MEMAGVHFRALATADSETIPQLTEVRTQSFQKAPIEESILNYANKPYTIPGPFLNQGLLEVLGTCRTLPTKTPNQWTGDPP